MTGQPTPELVRASIVLVLACAVAALSPVFFSDATPRHVSMSDTQWQSLAGSAWKRASLTALDRAFMSAQAGPIARFEQRARRLLVRRIETPSRRLHPVADCLRALGYVVNRAPSTEVETGGASGFTATLKNETIHVEEWIVDAHGKRFSEVGEWYWSALFGHSEGPWTAYVLSWPLNAHAPRVIE